MKAAIRLWRVGVALLCLLLPVAAEANDEGSPLADLADWLTIPDFIVEAAVGTGVDASGKLQGESARFNDNVGAVFCRASAIGLPEPRTLTIVWFREADVRARTPLKLMKAAPHGHVQMLIPAAQAGSWRVEVQDSNGQVLAVVPFVVGKPSVTDDSPLKSVPPVKP